MLEYIIGVNFPLEYHFIPQREERETEKKYSERHLPIAQQRLNAMSKLCDVAERYGATGMANCFGETDLQFIFKNIARALLFYLRANLSSLTREVKKSVR